MSPSVDPGGTLVKHPDHILLSPRFVRHRFQYDVVHTNAEYHDQISDHDPQVVRLSNPNVR